MEFGEGVDDADLKVMRKFERCKGWTMEKMFKPNLNFYVPFFVNPQKETT